jgi:hypothetical protein
LCNRLLLDDYEVLCFDYFLSEGARQPRTLTMSQRFSVEYADVTDGITAHGNFDVVTNLAPLASMTDYLRFPLGGAQSRIDWHVAQT